jgi:hypothetical protein
MSNTYGRRTLRRRTGKSVVRRKCGDGLGSPSYGGNAATDWEVRRTGREEAVACYATDWEVRRTEEGISVSETFSPERRWGGVLWIDEQPFHFPNRGPQLTQGV